LEVVKIEGTERNKKIEEHFEVVKNQLGDVDKKRIELETKVKDIINQLQRKEREESERNKIIEITGNSKPKPQKETINNNNLVIYNLFVKIIPAISIILILLLLIYNMNYQTFKHPNTEVVKALLNIQLAI